jgi:hypothetical protein
LRKLLFRGILLSLQAKIVPELEKADLKAIFVGF